MQQPKVGDIVLTIDDDDQIAPAIIRVINGDHPVNDDGHYSVDVTVFTNTGTHEAEDILLTHSQEAAIAHLGGEEESSFAAFVR